MDLRFRPLNPVIKLLLALLAAIGLYALAGTVGVPWLLRSGLAQWSRQHPELSASIQGIRYNPFSAELALRQVDLSAGHDTGAARLRVERLSVDLAAWASLTQRHLVLSEILIVAPRLEVGSDAAALLGLLATPGANEASLPVRIDRLLLDQGQFHHQAAGGAEPLMLQWQNVSFELERFASDATEPAFLQLQASSDSTKLSAHASLTPAPLAVEGAVQLDGLPLPILWRHYLALPTLSLNKGAASLETPFTYRTGNGVVVGPGTVRLRDLELLDKNQPAPLLQAPAIEARGVKLYAEKRSVDIASITADHVQASAWLAADGTLNVSHYAKAEEEGGSGARWRYRIEQIALAEGRLGFQDRSRPDGPTVTLAPLSLRVENLGNGDQAVPYRMSLDGPINGQGRLQLNATAAKDGSPTLDIKAEQIPLALLDAYLQSIAKVKLRDGDLDVDGHLEYQADGAPQLQFSGEAAVNDLTVNRSDDDTELLKWRRLALKGVRLAYPKVGLHVAEIVAEQPYARVVIEADQVLNWAKLSVASSTPSRAGSPLPIAIDALRIRDGMADFADLTLRPEFAATIHRLEGAIKNLSSSPDTRAALLLEGQVDRYAPVQVQGLINPFQASAYSDIEMHFHDMDLTRLSPYSGKFAGYRIDKGKLTLDLRYRLQNRKLEAENQFIMDHLTLGERVESKDATSLPIALAIALLRDANGQIDIHLPISGNLDDPDFSLRDLYAQAITGLITKLVTSPFTVLGNLLEGDPEEYGRVSFAPGDTQLSATEQNKLLTLAKALQQRSSLTVEIRGTADPDQDRAALTDARLQSQLHHRWLDEWRAKSEILSDERKQAAIPESDYQRLLLGQYAASGLGTTQDQKLARKALLEKFAVTDMDLRLLAQQRAERVREFLLKDGGIAEQRVFLLDVAVESKPGQEMETQLMLNGS